MTNQDEEQVMKVNDVDYYEQHQQQQGQDGSLFLQESEGDLLVDPQQQDQMMMTMPSYEGGATTDHGSPSSAATLDGGSPSSTATLDGGSPSSTATLVDGTAYDNTNNNMMMMKTDQDYNTDHHTNDGATDGMMLQGHDGINDGSGAPNGQEPYFGAGGVQDDHDRHHHEGVGMQDLQDQEQASYKGNQANTQQPYHHQDDGNVNNNGSMMLTATEDDPPTPKTKNLSAGSDATDGAAAEDDSNKHPIESPTNENENQHENNAAAPTDANSVYALELQKMIHDTGAVLDTKLAATRTCVKTLLQEITMYVETVGQVQTEYRRIQGLEREEAARLDQIEPEIHGAVSQFQQQIVASSRSDGNGGGAIKRSSPAGMLGGRKRAPGEGAGDVVRGDSPPTNGGGGGLPKKKRTARRPAAQGGKKRKPLGQKNVGV